MLSSKMTSHTDDVNKWRLKNVVREPWLVKSGPWLVTEPFQLEIRSLLDPLCI